MNNSINQEKLELFCSLFKGREDVFAIRWEKGNRKGYMPAYFFDPYMYRLHKQNGGAFKNYTDKSYLKLNSQQIIKHIEGRQFIGIYPLLKNNTSWFIVADFDKGDWKEQCKKALEICRKHNLPAYLERSRSGNGGHIWLFFEQTYPAIKSRKIILTLFEQNSVFSKFDRNTSFDRLFPNQDYLSGKGLGNLIALPLNGKTLNQNNTCFINPETFVAYKNQWEFLKEIKRVQITTLDTIFQSFKNTDLNFNDVKTKNVNIPISGKLQIILKSSIILNRNGLNDLLITFLKDQLNFYNSNFFVKNKMGKSTWKTERYFKLIDEQEHHIEIPRGFIGKLIRFCIQNKMEYNFLDQRKKSESIKISSSIKLLKHQHIPLNIASKKDFGIIVSPPGSGKTIIGLKLIEQKKQPALIITHRKQIAEQWVERIENFFGIPKREIGKIGQGKMKIGKKITVALIQTLAKKIKNNPKDFNDAFGIIIIDECHHVPAKSFRETIHLLNPYYQYGLTATPFRKHNDEKLLFIYIGKIISEIKPQEIETFKKARIVIKNTKLNVPFNSKTDQFETLSKILIHDSERNNIILKDICYELDKGRKIIIITERVDHIKVLNQYLKNQYQIITISGEDNDISRKAKWKNIQQDNYQVIITTGQYFGEGTDVKNISCLFLVYPFSFKGKLIQYIGRIQRSELTPIIYDYRDIKISYLNKLFLKRNTYYRNFDKQATLFDDFDETKTTKIKVITIDKTIKVPVNELEFHYGMICFAYNNLPTKTTIQFEIENEEIQPEFEVLKPYFIKVLKSKFISVHIYVEFESNNIVSQIATSKDINQINKEIIESVKFKFVTHNFIKKKKIENKEEEGLITKINSLFKSENDLLESLLTSKNYIHKNQLLYLSKHHNHKILKIRFVLQPFSFVFLINGKENYHLVLETLDTKEATYIWSISKNPTLFNQELAKINQLLNQIRNSGRQSILKNNLENFSRIIHDYKDSGKGFYKWKNALEERLF